MNFPLTILAGATPRTTNITSSTHRGLTPISSTTPSTANSKQPFTEGEILTFGGMPVTSHFTGPVKVVTGRQYGALLRRRLPCYWRSSKGEYFSRCLEYTCQSPQLHCLHSWRHGPWTQPTLQCCNGLSRDSWIPEGEWYHPFVDMRNNGWEKGEWHRHGNSSGKGKSTYYPIHRSCMIHR